MAVGRLGFREDNIAFSGHNSELWSAPLVLQAGWVRVSPKLEANMVGFCFSASEHYGKQVWAGDGKVIWTISHS